MSLNQNTLESLSRNIGRTEQLHKIHNGEIFQYINKVSLTTGTEFIAGFRTGSGPKEVHIRVAISSDESVEVQLRSNCTISGGADVTSSIFNVNHNSLKTPSQATVFANPTVDVEGDLKLGFYGISSSAVFTESEQVLKPNTDHIMRVKFDKTNANAYIGFQFYEKLPLNGA